MLIVLSCL